MLAVRFVLVCKEPEVIPIEIGEVHFTDKYNPEARLLIPAAYTGEDGTIEGEYRIDGKTYGTPVRKERISLHPVKGLVISGKWHSDYGFQQTVLVKNGRPSQSFPACSRGSRRTALCFSVQDSYDPQSVFRIYPQALQQCRESRHGGLRIRLVRKEEVLPDIPVQP